jgi:glycosyltransferase involved in cell wall biosynthesis
MTSPSPRVSVVIGAWNAAATLPRAIDSILRQTVQELELIVVDDGSTDETRDVVLGIGDPRVRYVDLPHVGISRSLNAGLREARSDFVVLQDADDWSLPTRLERQVEVLRTRPEVAVVGCRMKEVDENGHEFRPRYGGLTGDIRHLLMRFNPIPNTSAAVRRSAVLAVGGYDPRYRYAMEYDLWLRLSDRHEIVNLPEFLGVWQMSRSTFGASHERDQVRESIAAKAATLRRRRTLRGATGLVRPTLAFLTPLPVKRALRQARRQSR